MWRAALDLDDLPGWAQVNTFKPLRGSLLGLTPHSQGPKSRQPTQLQTSAKFPQDVAAVEAWAQNLDPYQKIRRRAWLGGPNCSF